MASAFVSSLQINFATHCYPGRVCLLSTSQRRLNVLAVVERPKQRRTQRPRIEPKAPPLGVPLEGQDFSPPLARELDFLLNHPIAEVTVTGLVILSALGFAVETVDLGNELLNRIPIVMENVIASLFTAEYLCRLYSRKFSIRYLLSKPMLVDLVAIAPLFLNFAEGNTIFVRLLRLSRIYRLQRLMSEEWRGALGDVTETQIRLANVALSVFSIIYTSAGFFYFAEVSVNPQVLTFFDAFYFSTITLFTVGFGDISPITGAGRVVTVLTVLSGAVLIPFQLAEVEKARDASRKSEALRKTQAQKEPPGFLNDMIPIDYTIECSRCHLLGHQKDARYCRSCANLLKNRRFDKPND